MSIQITGPRRAIEELISCQAIPGAKVRDLHRIVWIEVPELGLDLELAVRRAGCKVHDAEARKRTHY